MDMNSAPARQWLDFKLYENMMAFIDKWRENGIIDSDLAGRLRGDLEAELYKRQNNNISEMHRLINKAFCYSPELGHHPEHLLFNMATGEW